MSRPCLNKFYPELICCLAVAVYLSLFAFQSFAQIYSSVGVELNGNTSSISIGEQIYVTQDTEGTLNEKILVNRHNNNLRGKLQDSEIINLGLNDTKHWFLFSAVNNTNKIDWVLFFGHLSEGRMAMANRLFVYNATTDRVLINAMRDPNDPATFGQNISGPGVHVELAPNQSNIIVAFFEIQGPYANIIRPKLMTADAYNATLHHGDVTSKLIVFLFITIVGCFMAVSYVKSNWTYLIASAYFLIYMVLYVLLSYFFFAPYSFTAGLLTFLNGLGTLCGIAFTYFFLGIKEYYRKQQLSLFALAGLVLIVSLTNLFMFDQTNWLYNALFFYSILFASIGMAVISGLQTLEGKFGGPHITASWAIFTLGWIITNMTYSGAFITTGFTVNTIWFALIIQAFFFIAGTAKKVQMQEEEAKQVRARKNREAQSLYRLQQSKESADQSRLLRIIEREREVMSELRERERKRTEDMRVAKENADEANRAKSAFLAVVSHEIRTPMTGIMGMVRLMMDNTKLSKDQADYALAIQKSGDTMMALLNDILDFEKIETGNMTLETIDFDLPKLMNGVVTLMSGHADEKGITIKTDIPENAPRFFRGDPTRLRQVILNLTNNAIKFTEQGNVTLRLRINELVGKNDKTKGDYEVYFAIEDTGIGISEEAQQKLFSPFVQAEESITRQYGGTGLGLAICRKLIEAMGSSIHVTSEEGSGSTFFFTILLEKGMPEASEDSVQPDGKISQKYDAPPMNILVIEDNLMNRRVLYGFLEKYGHKVTLTESGEDAMDQLATKSFDLILSDVKLQGMSGIDVTRAIRALPDKAKAATPIIALTGNVRQQDIESYYAANMNGFLPKPINPNKLSEVVYRAHLNEFENPIQIAKAEQGVPIHDLADDLNMDADIDTQTQPQNVVDNHETPVHTTEEHQEPQPELGEPPKEQDVSALQQYVMSEQDISEEDLEADSFAEAIDAAQDAEGQKEPESVPEDLLDAAPVQDHTNEDFSAQMLGDLLDSLGKEQIVNLLNDTFTFADDIIVKIADAKAADNIEGIEARAHELKGMAANFGITKLSVIAGDIESAAKNGDLESAKSRIDELAPAKESATTAIQQWMAQQ